MENVSYQLWIGHCIYTDLQLYHGSILDLDLDDNNDEFEFIHVADQFIKTT